LRLLRPRGSGEAISAAWVVLAAGVLLGSVFTLAGFLGSLEHRHAVLVSRTPVVASSAARVGQPNAMGFDDQEDVGGTALAYLVIHVPPGAQVRPPAGIPRWPAAGEVLASPAAAELLRGNPYAATLAPGRLAGTIGPQALRDPDEAFAVVGESGQQVQASGQGLPIAGFGGPNPNSNLDDVTSGHVLTCLGLAAVILAGGTGVLFSTVTRLATRARRRRLAVLQLLGAPTSLVRALAAATSAALAGLGAVGACLLARPLGLLAAQAGVCGVHWWPRSSWTGLPVMIVASLITVAAVAATARLTVEDDPWARRRNTADPRPSILRVLPFLLGLCMLAGVLVTQHRDGAHGRLLSGQGVAILFAGLLALTVGAPLAAPFLTRAAAAAAQRSPRLGWRLAGARTHHHAASTGRLAGAIMALVLITGITIGIWDKAQAVYQRTAHGNLTLPLTPPPATTWVQQTVAAALSSPDLVSVTVWRNFRTHPDASPQRITRPDQLRSDDETYSITLPAPAARDLAARIERAHPGTRVFNHATAIPYAVMLDTAVVLLAQLLATIIVVLCLAITLITLQHDRAVPDTALLMSGLSRRQLRSTRAAEVSLTMLPGILLTIAIAWQAARATSHIDDTTAAAPNGPLIQLTVAALAVTALLAAAAAAATPHLDPATIRRD
jgi:hypothetical protein